MEGAVGHLEAEVAGEDRFVAFEEGLVEAVKGHEPSPVERLVVLAVVGHMRLM